MVVCCVEHCGLSTDDNVILFEFPTSRLLRKRWLDAINPGSKIAEDARICSKHFSKQDYEEVRGKTRLKGKVVPSRFGEQMETEEESSQKLDTEINKQDKTSRNSHNDNHEDKSHKHIDKLYNGSDNSRKNSDNSGKSDSDSDYDGKPRKRKRGRPKKSKNTKNVQLKIKFNKRTTNNSCDNKKSDNNEVDNSNNDKDTERTENNHDDKLLDEGDKSDKSHNDDNDTDNRKKTIENGHSSNISRERDKSPQSMPADIEDIISKYQIENKKTERQLAAMAQELLMQAAEPVFIELQVSQDPQDPPSNDCLMLLESVQVEVDPTLMLQARAEDEECMEHVDLDADSGGEPEGDKKPDGFHQPEISLLTSSDEDDVIIQEPKIDTVEVSDETDEDDVPLVRLAKAEAKAQRQKKKKKSLISRILWKGSDEVYCVQCRHVSETRNEHKKHLQIHSKVIQICQDCGFTTCSKSQLYRHRRKHKNEKKHKCPLCNYSARHNMSLIYHLKTHKDNEKDVFMCENCDFVSPVKTELTKHKQGCSRGKFSCLSCEYTSPSREQVQRHEHRAHRRGGGGGRGRGGDAARRGGGGGGEVHSLDDDSTNAEDED